MVFLCPRWCIDAAPLGPPPHDPRQGADSRVAQTTQVFNPRWACDPTCLYLVARAIRTNRFARIDLRESIRANHSQFKPHFYSASGRFARVTRISDSRESRH